MKHPAVSSYAQAASCCPLLFSAKRKGSVRDESRYRQLRRVHHCYAGHFPACVSAHVIVCMRARERPLERRRERFCLH
eukprot:4730395-Pleurochrysis_carterae.AAC.3